MHTNSPIHIYISIINNRLVFEIKDRYKLGLQTHENMKLFAARRRIIDKTKNDENKPNIKVVEILLASSNVVDNQYQQKCRY